MVAFAGFVAVTIASAMLNAMPAAEVTTGRTNLTEADVAIVVADVEPQMRETYWRCDLPMTIRPAAGEGVTVGEIREQLRYPVATLRALGYDVTVGAPVDYQQDMPLAQTWGEIVVVATDDESEQVELDGVAARAWLNTNGPEIVASTVYVNTGDGALSGDVLLHELGHVLGLGHHAGSVMDDGWYAPADFDASDVAAVACH